MILIKKLQNPLFLANLFLNKAAISKTLTLNNNSNPLAQIPLEKVLKLCGNKKCNTVADAMFCVLVF